MAAQHKKRKKMEKTRHHMPSNISTQAIYKVFLIPKNHRTEYDQTSEHKDKFIGHIRDRETTIRL